ncbi:hypothetical protein C2G38_2241025 [Gigaspora rosea]|uniref:Concanavalin A-like lectin/glucanase domain-containing protein n=1 Tax=Gigaspora rosea TaxID=44941 RepID=A0A397VW16_9GLOM|nr:hypothetical protein C2G38_2241025 [Gigaspora rosea]
MCNELKAPIIAWARTHYYKIDTAGKEKRGTTIFTPEYNRVIDHAELPVVKNELSITLKLYLERHGPGWYAVFYKGRARATRTPALWLRSGDSAPCPPYTLSNPDKRMNLYIDGEWVGSFSMTNIHWQSFIFNNEPLYIGRNFDLNGFTGQISEVLKDYSGENPTKHKGNDESLKKYFVDLTIAFFLGMMALAGGLFIHKIIIRRRYQTIPNPT